MSGLSEEARRACAGAGWPQALLEDAGKAPRVVETREAFLEELVHGSHLNQVVVFPEGARLLGQDVALDPKVRAAAEAAGTAYEFLERLDELDRERLVACVAWSSGQETRRLEMASLAAQWKLVQAGCPAKRRGSSYIAELRRKGDVLVPALSRTMKTAVATDDHLFWDDQGGGIFIGGPGAGYHLHQDSHHVSQIGTNWVGWKLFAMWRHGEESLEVIENHGDTFFLPPLSEAQLCALESAACVALVPPGAVFLFSGANAHVVLNVGSGCCCVGYESFVNLHLDHVRAVLGTHDPDVHHEDCWMDSGARGLRRLAEAVAARLRVPSAASDLVAESEAPLARALKEALWNRGKRLRDADGESAEPPLRRPRCGEATSTEAEAAEAEDGAAQDDASAQGVSDDWLASLTQA
eukprot:TRINITY_DN28136_c0_g1_i1.p1 TRINITY_DN28136_c0_g1~~TRINITY_DN28136_c0_g1_i1.p1  ORF type:complete len:410 (+),score=98.33 TRINITY_DN28136_c0_g1_i1:117-1346(+)